MKYSFNNVKVASLESRRSREIEELIQYYGGKPVTAESVREVPSVSDKDIHSLIDNLDKKNIDALVFMTAYGTKILLDAVEQKIGKKKTINLLNRTNIIGRGIKSRSALRNYGIKILNTKPVPNTWQDITQLLSSRNMLANKTIALQQQSRKNKRLANALKTGGAEVLSIPVYRSMLPEDTENLQKLIEQISANNIDVCLFTNSQQIKNINTFAKKAGTLKKMLDGFKKVVVTSVGHSTTTSLLENGLTVDYEPENPRMGNLVRETARRFQYLIHKKKTAFKNSVNTNNWKRTEMDWGISSDKERKSITRKSAFIKTCMKESTSYKPVWIMRQAGRFSRHYRQIRSKYTFQQLCKTPEIASEVTLMAVDQLGVDAAIIFSDILLILEPLGIRLSYSRTDGPRIENMFRTKSSLDRLNEFDEKELNYVYRAIKLTRKALNPEIPLIGFAGAPFTLASYAIEGGASRNYENTKGIMYRDSELWNEIMRVLTHATVKYLNRQIDSGADAVQIFDSWIGCLSPFDYEKYVLPHMTYLFENINKTVPSIHFGTGTSTLLKLMKQAGGDVMGLDWRVDIKKAWKEIGYDSAIQGNLDPVVLFSTPSEIKKRVQLMLSKTRGRNGHIFNLGHGVLPGTPPDNVLHLIDAVHEYSSKN